MSMWNFKWINGLCKCFEYRKGLVALSKTGSQMPTVAFCEWNWLFGLNLW